MGMRELIKNNELVEQNGSSSIECSTFFGAIELPPFTPSVSMTVDLRVQEVRNCHVKRYLRPRNTLLIVPFFFHIEFKSGKVLRSGKLEN